MPAAGDVVNASDVTTRLATLPINANSTTYGATETSIATITASVVTGLTYKILAYLTIGVDVAGDVSTLRIREDTVAGTQFNLGNVDGRTTISTGYSILLYAEYTAVATLSKTWVITGQRGSGTGTAHGIKASTSRFCWVTVDLIVS